MRSGLLRTRVGLRDQAQRDCEGSWCDGSTRSLAGESGGGGDGDSGGKCESPGLRSETWGTRLSRYPELICTQMRNSNRRKLAQIAACSVVAVFAGTDTTWAAPCSGVDRSLTREQKAAVAPEIARQLQVKAVDVMQSFHAGGWSIFYVDTHETDDAYVFYSRVPARGRYVTLWGGAATTDEEHAIRMWTIKNAPGIPRNLAGCFAWSVTKGNR